MRFIRFLLNNYELVKNSNISSVSTVSTYSGKVKKSSLFVALKGRKTDGHYYLPQAIERGAGILLVNQTRFVPSGFKGMVLKYNGQLKGFSNILNKFYQYPSEKLFVVGVTGTNGKTSFCYLLEHLFKGCGWPTALMGTVDQHFNQHKWSSALTTPQPSEMFERLNDFVNLGAKSVVMEVSSIALDQGRVEGVDFKALVFTNLSQDHLDYHKNKESYFQAKKKLFISTGYSRNKNCFCLVNRDDEYGQRLLKFIKWPCYTYGQNTSSDFYFKIKEQSHLSSVFELKGPSGINEFTLPLVGEHNIYNAVAAISCAILTGFKAEVCRRILENFKAPPGRLQKVAPHQKPFQVFIDYAHTPSAISCVLKTLRAQFKNIILVFGCGGDRDKKKRSQMMKAALNFADSVFLTTDNPRFEDPDDIVKEALACVSNIEQSKITVELDRKKAITRAIQSAKKGGCVLIAGKGHEEYQIVKGQRIPFSDYKEALVTLKP